MALESYEFGAATVALVGAVAAAVKIAANWIFGHITALANQNAALAEKIQKDAAEDKTRFLAALEKQQTSFKDALKEIQDECAKERQADREMLLLLLGRQGEVIKFADDAKKQESQKPS